MIFYISQIVISSVAFLGLACVWGRRGIFCYVALGAFVGNIQVLKLIALPRGWIAAEGTIVFCSLFWAHDVLTEMYGKKTALQCLLLSFVAAMLGMVWMQITLHMPTAFVPGNASVQRAMKTLFSPAPSLVAASFIAYGVSQVLDILIFSRLKRLWQGRFLWLRSSASSIAGTLADHILFSWLAFQLFSAAPLPLKKWWAIYVVSGYGLRLGLAALSPVIVKAAMSLGRRQKTAIL